MSGFVGIRGGVMRRCVDGYTGSVYKYLTQWIRSKSRNGHVNGSPCSVHISASVAFAAGRREKPDHFSCQNFLIAGLLLSPPGTLELVWAALALSFAMGWVEHSRKMMVSY